MKSLSVFIREQLENHTDEHIILEPMRFDERFGLFYGCQEMTEIIIKKIKYYWETKSNEYPNGFGFEMLPKDFNNIDNVFFSVLRIYVTDAFNSTYNPNVTVYNEDAHKLEYVEIVINVNGDDNELQRKIEHELTHAFEDYNRKVFFSKSLREILDENYIKAIKKMSNMNNKLEEIQSARFIHYLNKQEINANMGAFEAALHNKKFDKYEDGMKLIKATNTYKHYEDLAEVLELMIEKKLEKEVIDDICNSLRSYDEYKNHTNNQIIKNLENRLRKFFKKFNKIIPKLVYDKLSNVNDK